jgi:transposase
MDGGQTTTEQDESSRSAHKSSHMSAPQRIEVITRGERRRRWSVEEKREIVAESLRPGMRPSEVIRKHGISSGQLSSWRRQLTTRLGSELPRPSAGFARVDVILAQRQKNPTADSTAAAARPLATVPPAAPPRAEGLIEIVLPSGASVRVDAHVNGRALRCVLGALHER